MSTFVSWAMAYCAAVTAFLSFVYSSDTLKGATNRILLAVFTIGLAIYTKQ